ncbi:restriction endonuclease subunit S [Elizabethkingia anophelis]|nr:restriction endonuclease subunit S [Elizabethkingia anophelis]MCT3694724.1 restriction endonuclease subunit S [Elizabethkingia anophelis]MCT3858048.1 restriction endonuclease subunit S [Elizabethkingia anophelis]MCT3911534.1 restriction endonuclease subunit S [Elizabethkingia anophelis]MCT4311113.1 restriction endonuclease subunit S [Elizabethkingia anophelis]
MKRYDKYKNSSVDWIEEIPEHWKILPGLSFIYENKAKNKGMIRNTVLSLSYGKIRIKEESELTGLVPESFETYQLVNIGDLIFRPTDLQNDMVSLRSSISEYNGIITSAYLNLRFKQNAKPKFFHYFFRSIDNNKIIYGLGSGLRQNISYLDFRRFNFPFPPLPEQQTIASFLDDKTAKIDQTISIKEKEIELLKERRQILIQKAVTKGLDNSVKLKDSGIEWIGGIPEHWGLKKLKYLTKCLNTKRIPLETTIRGSMEQKKYPYYGATGIIDYVEDYIFDEETILIAEDGANLIFRNLQLIYKPQGKYWVNNHSHILRPLNHINRNYLAFLMECFDYTIYISGAAQPKLTKENLLNILFFSPPLVEQNRIVTYLEKIEEKISKAISLKQQEIEKLKEYKTVLIDNVVTGKISVC